MHAHAALWGLLHAPVHAERLTVIGDLGLQFSHKRLLGATRRFVPMSRVRDVIISEVGLCASSSSSSSSSGNPRACMQQQRVRVVSVGQEVQVYRVVYHVAVVLGDEQEIIVPFQVQPAPKTHACSLRRVHAFS